MRTHSLTLAWLLCACTTTKVEYRTVYDTTIVYVPDVEYIPIEKEVVEQDVAEPTGCTQPTPLTCGDQCCPLNYGCGCEKSKIAGVCLPGNATLCDCNDPEPFCPPSEACIKDKTCRQKGLKCKPLGAGGVENEDCPEAPKCYCDPYLTCTHKEPACCPLTTPIPCGDHCCFPDNSCLPKNVDDGCLAPDEEFCGKIFPGCSEVCEPGKECKTTSCGCKPDDDVECVNFPGTICPISMPVCVSKQLTPGPGGLMEVKGINNSGCCPANIPVGCQGYCCPLKTSCYSTMKSIKVGKKACDGCVKDGYKCCPDDVTTCLKNEYCSIKSPTECLDDPAQDCKTYTCPSKQVCSTGPQKCCPATNPMTCGSNCCYSFETCYNGICLKKDETPCGSSKCGPGWECMKSKAVCMPNGFTDCGDACYCNSKEACYKADGKWKCAAKNIICDGCCCPENYECVSNSPGVYKYIPNKYCCMKGSSKPPCPNPSSGCSACYPGSSTESIWLGGMPNAVCK